MFDLYTSFSWKAKCKAVKKLKIKLSKAEVTADSESETGKKPVEVTSTPLDPALLD